MYRIITASFILLFMTACGQLGSGIFPPQRDGDQSRVVDIDRSLEETATQIKRSKQDNTQADTTPDKQPMFSSQPVDPNAPISLSEPLSPPSSADLRRRHKDLEAVLKAMDQTLSKLHTLLDDVGPKIDEIRQLEQTLQSLIQHARSLRTTSPQNTTSTSSAAPKQPSAGQVYTSEKVRAAKRKAKTAPAKSQTRRQAYSKPDAYATNFRLGDHIDYVRLVVDFRAGAEIDYERLADTDQTRVTVLLKDTAWRASKTRDEYPFKPFIDGYHAVQDGPHTRLNLSLAANARVSNVFALDEGGTHPRLVIDLRHK